MKGFQKASRRLLSWLLIFAVSSGAAILHTPAAAHAEGDLSIEAPSAILIEASTGKVIYEKNPDEQRNLASVTKIMTILLIFEALESGKITLEDKVTVSEHAASMGGSQVYLEVGETQTVKDMLKCIVIASANDASVAMAEHLAGTEEEFVARMNEKCKELGMENTHFLNCCGLDDEIDKGHYSSARDIGIMSRELITRFPEVSEYSTVWMDAITHVTRKGESEFGLTNTNKLIRTYDGITGLKTGSTSKAKFCLSATASRNGMSLIAVIMAAPTPVLRFKEAAMLLDYGFANCSLYQDHHEDFQNICLPVAKGKEDTVELGAATPFSYICVLGESPDSIEKAVHLPEFLEAPIAAGDKVGKIQYSMNGVDIGSVDIVATTAVDKRTYLDCLKKVAISFLIGEADADRFS